jgi:tetratricopeptide (TPR) repeat protein
MLERFDILGIRILPNVLMVIACFRWETVQVPFQRAREEIRPAPGHTIRLTEDVENRFTSGTLSAMTYGVGRKFEDAEIYFREGEQYREREAHGKALECFEQAIRRNPSHAAALFAKGMVLAKIGRWLDAAAAYREAVRLNPENAEAHLNLGFVYYELGYDEEARQAFETAQRYNPALHPPF